MSQKEDTSNGAAVSTRYGLVKMKHKDRFDTSIFRLWHLLNESEVGSSAVACGYNF